MKKIIIIICILVASQWVFSDWVAAKSKYSRPKKSKPVTEQVTTEVITEETVTVEETGNDQTSSGQTGYHVGPGDVLSVQVFGQEELTNKYKVGEDGKIDFPLIGTVTVEKLSPTEIKNKIKNALGADYLVNPEIQVSVESYRAQGKIYVSGAVKTAGAYPYETGLTALNAIVLAGGFTELASTSKAKLTRRTGNQSKTVTINLKKMLKGKEKDVVLQPGDRLYVPESLF